MLHNGITECVEVYIFIDIFLRNRIKINQSTVTKFIQLNANILSTGVTQVTSLNGNNVNRLFGWVMMKMKKHLIYVNNISIHYLVKVGLLRMVNDKSITL